MKKLNFPVFTGCTVSSHAYSHIVDVGKVVRVGALIVHPGDILHGDGDGVTSIPSEIADGIANVADEFIAAERILLDYAQGPGEKSVAELMDRRKATAAAIATLGGRVARKAH